MSATGTVSKTFTTVDIRKVVENFAADASMMAQSTGLASRDFIGKVVADLNKFAAARLLVSVKIMLKDAQGIKLCAAVYQVSEAAVGWVSERPGNSLWPRTPDGSLHINATFTEGWWQKSAAQKEAFVKEHGLHWPWDPTTEDLSLVGLTVSAGRKYASNGYGLQRNDYSTL